MAKLNFLVYLNTYSDIQSTNNPSLNTFKRTRDLNSFPVENPIGFEFTLAPGETKILFDGTRTLTQDITTQYSIALTPFETSSYRLSWSGGTAPHFRTPRTSGADATTAVTVTTNGPVVTFTSTGGTNFSLISGGVVVGDYVRIGNLFNQLNQGEWKIISRNANSFSVVNESGANEGPIVLGSGFATQVQIYSAAGVQIGDTLQITGGFSLVTQGSYIVIGVSDSFIDFSTTSVLPIEGPITTEAIAVYSDAKRLVYLESDQHVNMILNSISGDEINPLIDSSGNVIPGIFMRTSIVYSMSVTNSSTDTASLFFGAIE